MGSPGPQTCVAAENCAVRSASVALGQLTLRAVTGLLTLVPGVAQLELRVGKPGPASALYAYGVWLQHMTAARRAGLETDYAAVAEIGPGRTLGVGVCALLCGASSYYAWDRVHYTSVAENVALLDELARLFEADAVAPEGAFSSAMLDQERPTAVLPKSARAAWSNPERRDAIRAALQNPGVRCDGIVVDYRTTLDLTEPRDLILSQAVLEHVDAIEAEHRRIAAALRPGGIASHRIDFKSHGFARAWNGHWTLGDLEWRLVRGRRTYAINRAPLHEHVAAMQAAGLEVAAIVRVKLPNTLARGDLKPRFARMPDADLTTSSALIQAIRA
jgi:SAM-dependent methyltransferase